MEVVNPLLEARDIAEYKGARRTGLGVWQALGNSEGTGHDGLLSLWSRQVDPVRDIARGGAASGAISKVLICPTRQGMHDWKADLDPCSRCGSVRLVRRLGE